MVESNAYLSSFSFVNQPWLSCVRPLLRLLIMNAVVKAAAGTAISKGTVFAGLLQLFTNDKTHDEPVYCWRLPSAPRGHLWFLDRWASQDREAPHMATCLVQANRESERLQQDETDKLPTRQWTDNHRHSITLAIFYWLDVYSSCWVSPILKRKTLYDGVNIRRQGSWRATLHHVELGILSSKELLLHLLFFFF